MQHYKLMEPYSVLNLKNRLVMAPMTRCRCDEFGLPSKQLGKYYIERAKSGIGLIIIESSAVNNKDACGYKNGCQMNCEAHVKAWQPIVDEIHAYGAKVWIQVFHAGRLSVPEIGKGIPLAPSAIKPQGQASFWRPNINGEIVHFQSNTPFVEPKEMNYEEIDRVLFDFQESCRFSALAGFDGVELHGAHGYLIHEFCSKFANKRDDVYSVSKDFLFVSKLVEMCKQVLPEHMNLSYRLSTHMLDNTYLRMDDVDLNRLIPILDNSGVNVFHSSELEVGQRAFRSKHSLGEQIRNLTDKSIIGCGRLNSMLDAEKIIGSNNYDLLAFGRTLILNKEVPIDDNGKRFDYNEDFNCL
jgi:N-ethylmaleimide reductase